MRLEIDEEARDEIADAAVYYEVHREGYGQRFLEAVDTTIASIEHMPRAGQALPEAQAELAARHRRIAGFPYDWLIYAVLDETIYVLAMAHASRLPGYWLARLRKLTQ